MIVGLHPPVSHINLGAILHTLGVGVDLYKSSCTSACLHKNIDQKRRVGGISQGVGRRDFPGAGQVLGYFGTRL